MKNHEKIHTAIEPFTCMDCDKEFTAEDSKYKGKLSRCPECYKKSKNNPDNKRICEFYKAGHCKYGPQGQNKEGKCYNRHPEPCQKDGECTDKKCAFMHAAPVCTFFKKQACKRKFCKFTHPKPVQKGGQKSDVHQSKKVENLDQNKKNDSHWEKS